MSVCHKLSVLVLTLLAASSFAQQSAPVEEGPEVWAARVARAARLRADATALQKTADEQRKQEDIRCRASFFENACRDSVREAWLEQVNTARAMEMEAVGLERSIRAHDLSVRERNRSRQRVPKPSELQMEIAPGKTPAAPRSPASLRRDSDADKQEKAERRSKEADAAALRAEQAKADAARYAARRKEHAARKASSSAASK